MLRRPWVQRSHGSVSCTEVRWSKECVKAAVSTLPLWQGDDPSHSPMPPQARVCLHGDQDAREGWALPFAALSPLEVWSELPC